MPATSLDQLVSLCKRRGFVFPGSEIYGGLANTWDYGPLGVELKNQIEIWKRPDQEYELKIDHTVNPDLASAGQTSVVDAEAIICWALAEYHGFSGDALLMKDHRERFERRVSTLIAAQHPRTAITRGGYRNRQPSDEYYPNSGQWPSVGGS